MLRNFFNREQGQGLGEAAKAVRLGDPFDESTQMGALINAQHRDRVTGYIAKGSEEGATLVAGGGTPDRKGYFVEPTVFAGGGNDLTIAQDEIFGPVGLVLPFVAGRLRGRRAQTSRK